MSTYLTDDVWELEYTTLDASGLYRLCLAGACRRCGGRLCMSVEKADGLSGDDFLSSLYRHLYQINGKFGPYLVYADFRERFVRLFHEQDQAFIREWLERPENQSVFSMNNCKNKKDSEENISVYTIVRTGIDTDRGYFPDPQAEGSFLSLRRARLHLNRLIRAEKETLDGRYDSEDRGEDYWEASQKEYASALFSRLEILGSEVCIANESQASTPFKPSDYLEQCAECFEQCCKDGQSECGMLEEARKEQLAIQTEERDAHRRFFRMWRMAKNSQDLEVE